MASIILIEAPTEAGASLSVLVIGRCTWFLATGALQDQSARSVQHFYYVTWIAPL